MSSFQQVGTLLLLSVFCSGNPKPELPISAMVPSLEGPFQSFWSDLWWQLFSSIENHLIPVTAFLQGLRTDGWRRRRFFFSPEKQTAAPRVQELNHSKSSNKHNLSPEFSFYGTFPCSVLYSNFPPFSLASSVYYFPSLSSLLQSPISNGRAITRQAWSSLIETLIGVHLKTRKASME